LFEFNYVILLLIRSDILFKILNIIFDDFYNNIRVANLYDEKNEYYLIFLNNCSCIEFSFDEKNILMN
jgi:hypothetical protein